MPACEKRVLNSSNEPNAESIAEASSPDGAPPPFVRFPLGRDTPGRSNFLLVTNVVITTDDVYDVIRVGGGAIFLVGALLMMWNVWMTIRQGSSAIPASDPPPDAAPAVAGGA